ncbi:hypothetical protein UFOVP777_27 [uncultured Caudovirales phage]|uniref:Uncharacterized protein n=1 Tax=uncultured Caudovirales phage TaxID=2100421 RepID=A0A6J5P3X0_9CAUD|nr:hypothetical protein UFOVP777_27 [uncultured Caudovirales phage]
MKLTAIQKSAMLQYARVGYFELRTVYQENTYRRLFRLGLVMVNGLSPMGERVLRQLLTGEPSTGNGVINGK